MEIPNEIKQIVTLCMIHKEFSCEINKDTIIVLHFNGWEQTRLESFHTEETMKKEGRFGYIPLNDLVDKVKELI